VTDEKPIAELEEEGAIERLVDGLNRRRDIDPVEELGELLEEPFVRGYLESIGYLALANEPLALSFEVKERLLGALEAEGALEEEAGSVLIPFAPQRSAAGEPRTGSWSAWPLRLAATLALALLGLSAWQLLRLDRQEQAIARLSTQLRETEQQSVQLAELRNQLADVQDKLGVVTSPAVEVCSLSPVGDDPLQPQSRGTLYVAADHQHWYLKVDGLRPCPEDSAYQLWFITAGGRPVSAGTFDVRTGARLELSSETMPAGTTAVRITIEPLSGSPQPSGPSVLYGDEVMRIL
jgi:hypothetical protein